MQPKKQRRLPGRVGGSESISSGMRNRCERGSTQSLSICIAARRATIAGDNPFWIARVELMSILRQSIFRGF